MADGSARKGQQITEWELMDEAEDEFFDAADEGIHLSRADQPTARLESQATVLDEFYQAQSIMAMKNPYNCAREVVVSWDKPQKESEISHFEVYLQFNGNKETKSLKIDSGKPMKAMFKSLKSDTEYKAFVKTVYKNKREVTAQSKPVKTDTAQRTPGFVIETQGKPVIKVSQERERDDIFGVFEWALPDLGTDDGNYKILSEEPSLKQDGKHSVAIDTEHRQVKRVKLNWGKSYSFTVICNYRDLDTGDVCQAKALKILNADIGKHSIDDVKWIDKHVMVSWSKAMGAKRHVVVVTDEEGKVVVEPRTVKQAPTTIHAKEKLAYGNTYNFILEAYDDREKRFSVKRKTLLGGSEAVTGVVAKRDQVNPRRGVHVTWQPPAVRAEGYRLILYDLVENKSVQEDVSGSKLEHKFGELKTSNPYCICVCPIYNGSPCEGTLSNTIETGKSEYFN